MADLVRVSIFGTMPGGEEWSFNPVWAIGGDFGESVSSEQAQDIAEAIAVVGMGGDARNCMSSSCFHTGVRVEARTKAGALEALGEAGLAGGPNPGAGSSAHPFQTSLVVSLRTAHAGASGRGRMYLVATGVPISASTLRPSTAFTAAIATGTAAWLAAVSTAIETVLSGAATPVVWSRKNNATYPITSVQVGDVLDVQRRRRDTLVEAIESAPV